MTKITFGMAWEKQEAKRVRKMEFLRRQWQKWQDSVDNTESAEEFQLMVDSLLIDVKSLGEVR